MIIKVMLKCCQDSSHVYLFINVPVLVMCYRTALAEAELEYNEEHRSTAVYVKFPLTRLPESLTAHIGEQLRPAGLTGAELQQLLPLLLPSGST